MSTNEAHSFPTRLVDVGGYRLTVSCTGTGSPTVVLDAGMGDSSEIWYKVQKAVSKFACVCSYDRAGSGQSDPGPLPRTSLTIVHELHTLLTKANIPGPYVFVGHSFGGFNARVYASQYPDEVVGLVLVDTSHPDLDLVSLLPAEEADENNGLRQIRAVLKNESEGNDNSEGIDLATSAVEVRSISSLGALPLVILTHTSACWIEMLTTNFPDFPLELATRLEQAWQKYQQYLLRLSSYSHQMIAQRSGHYIHLDEPALVVNTIRSVIELIQADKPFAASI